jgi:hypothetical protein
MEPEIRQILLVGVLGFIVISGWTWLFYLVPKYPKLVLMIALPLMMLSRAMKKGDSAGQVDVLEELRLPSTVNTILSVILKIEFLLIRFGVRFPVGGSRIVVAQKAVR